MVPLGTEEGLYRQTRLLEVHPLIGRSVTIRPRPDGITWSPTATSSPPTAQRACRVRQGPPKIRKSAAAGRPLPHERGQFRDYTCHSVHPDPALPPARICSTRSANSSRSDARNADRPSASGSHELVHRSKVSPLRRNAPQLAGLVEEVDPVQTPAAAPLDELQLPPEQRMKRMHHPHPRRIDSRIIGITCS
jgi:hypothetical protein